MAGEIKQLTIFEGENISAPTQSPVSGALANILSTSSNYTILDNDGYDTFLVTAASDVTMTLPTLADNNGRKMTFKKVDAGTGRVILDGEGSETIDGALILKLFATYDTVEITGDGLQWRITGAQWASGSYSPTTYVVNNLNSAPTLSKALFTKNKNVVTCTVNVAVSLTASGANQTRFDVDLPIFRTTNFSNQAIGVASYTNGTSHVSTAGVVFATSTNSRVRIDLRNIVTANLSGSVLCTFQYELD